jgi:vancomycin permeability regulator SanA
MFIKIAKRILLGLCAVIGTGVLVVVVLNLYMFFTTFTDIKSVDEAAQLEEVDCILVLGAGVRPGGKPSLMLQDRLDKALELYNAGVSDKIIVSGDHRENDYNEVQVMKNYLMDKGVPSSAIFMDHAGLSTYDSMYRADYIFGVNSLVIVTQEYHMYRAIADAEAMGMKAYGVCAKKVVYNGQISRDIREIAARVKDIVYGIMKPEATVLGDPISLDESGDITND